MNKEREQKAIAALERQEARYKKQNEYIAATYDRQSVTFPKGTKDRIKAAAGGESVNSFINRAVLSELERIETEKSRKPL